jgi:alkanesulfonate monooxygenase SsuD/methylene tetrahydromethanopterin reductase-like flavin-dependent oxidoreductase (luciferase family)
VVSRLRTGVILPTFQETPTPAFEAARRATEAGVDGLFCYDHLWPMGQPERPALAPFPILGALAANLHRSGSDNGPFLGTLVSRAGLVPPAVQINQFLALAALAPGRVIAGLGTGDQLSQAENEAYGVPYPPAAERRATMVEVGTALRQAGIAVWIAGGIGARLTEARAVGAALNLWDATPQVVAERQAGVEGEAPIEVTWGGPAPKDPSQLGPQVAELGAAGATWVVFGWPVDLEVLVATAAQTEVG